MVQRVEVAAAVAVTNIFKTSGILLLSLCGLSLQAAVLPEDRADVMFHSYDGGGVTIDGPSVLVRKDIAGTV